MKELIQKIRSNVQELTQVTAYLIVLATIIAFGIKGLWYTYQLGYFKALGIDYTYIDVNSMGTLYYLLTHLGLAGLFLLSNAFTYSLCIKKYKKALIEFLLCEVIVFIIIAFIYSNISPVDAWHEMIHNKNQKDYIVLLALITVFILFSNMYGIYFGYQKRREQRKCSPSQNSHETKSNFDITTFILLILVSMLLYGLGAFLFGIHSSQNRDTYKIIIETVSPEKPESLKENYIFCIDDQEVQVFPILYENADIYIISYLLYNGRENVIETKRQRIIDKKGIETIYCEDLSKINSIIIE